jgi:hypothetical protein
MTFDVQVAMIRELQLLKACRPGHFLLAGGAPPPSLRLALTHDGVAFMHGELSEYAELVQVRRSLSITLSS